MHGVEVQMQLNILLAALATPIKMLEVHMAAKLLHKINFNKYKVVVAIATIVTKEVTNLTIVVVTI